MTTAIETLDAKIQELQDEISKWEMVKDAVEQERDPLRDRMVIKLGDEYHATHRWEINPTNGFLTVQLRDGSILPTRFGDWCPYAYAANHFELEGRNQITIDDPQE